MKKPASRSPKTPAPASAKPAAKAPLTKKVEPIQAPAVKEPAPSVKKPTPEKVVPTAIIAQVDIGFGNMLFVRGESAGLSWDKGVPMENVAADQWRLVLNGVAAPVAFKLLINDLTWSAGEDYVVVPGTTATVTPTF
jgi:hypothetical protein